MKDDPLALAQTVGLELALVYERGERADGSSYYAMQLVSGRTLARPPPVSELVPGVNAELAATCAKAMDRDPALRQRTALELAAALENFQSQAAKRAPSRLVAGVRNAGIGFVGLLALPLLALGVAGAWEVVIVHGGIMPVISCASTLVAFALAAIERKTHGEARLLGIWAVLVWAVVARQNALLAQPRRT